MKTTFVVLFCLLTISSAEYCFNDVISACAPVKPGNDLENCNAKYGDISTFSYDLQNFANKHITHSFQYLLMATHFENFESNRGGFTKLFRKLSDTTWNDAIDIIKYLAKRGVPMNFQAKYADSLVSSKNDGYELFEIESLSKALDIQKSLAIESHRIHNLARDDAEVMSHIENNFVHKFRDSIRELSGHTNDLKHLLNYNKKAALDVFLFDDYLKNL